MALAFLDDIYKISKTIFTMKKCIECCNCSDVWLFSQEWNSCSESIRELYDSYIENKNPLANDIRQLVDEVRTNVNNPMYCGAILEDRFIPLLYRIVDEAGKIDVEENDYRFLSSKSGLITIKSNISGNYWNSLIDPLKEAWDKSSLLFRPNAKNIVIMGCGLGYLAYQLWEKSYESAHIYILEHDPKMIDYARDFGVLDWINQDNLTIIVEEDREALFRKFVTFDVDMSKSIFTISDWEVENLDEDFKQQIVDYNENQKASIRYDERFNVNYYSNVDVFAGSLEDLREEQEKKNKSKQFIAVAAGPSLNKQMDYLRSAQDDKTIVAVDGALKKLLANGIKPDYVTALDPNKSLMHYVDGIESETIGIPLIADGVTYWEYIKKYQGPVYRVICADNKLNISDKEQYGIPDMGYHGTVSGLAIEVAAFFGAETIELVGLDLSFPGGKHHADGIGVDTSAKVEGEILVKSVTGEMVETNLTFEKFIREIEIQIENHKDIKFINKSDCGAYIRGSFCGAWFEKMPSVCDAKEYFNRLSKEKMLSWEEKYYILRQYFSKLKNGGMSNEEIIAGEVFNQAYYKICSEFLASVNVSKISEKNDNNKLILLITSKYKMGDEITNKLLEDADTFRNKYGFNVIIINTNEYYGGKHVSIDCDTEFEDSDAVFNDSIVYMGNRYPYINCEVAMPNIEYIEKVCDTLASYNIAGIISYDPMSLFAEACTEFGYVEYRFGDLKKNIEVVSDVTEKSKLFFSDLLTILNAGGDEWYDNSSPFFRELTEPEYCKQDVEDIRKLIKNLLQDSLTTQNERAIIACYSILIKTENDVESLEAFLDYLLDIPAPDYLRLDFVCKQIGGLIFRNNVLKTINVDIKAQKLLERCVEVTAKLVPEELLSPIKVEDRNSELVIVVTGQYLNIEHGPTKSALDRCYIIEKELNKKVLLINTAEIMQIAGNTPFYKTYTPNYIHEYIELSHVEWKNDSIPFFQADWGMPRMDLLIELIRFVRKTKPIYVVEIGCGSIFASLVSRFIPVLSDSMVPSNIGCFATQAITCSKKITDDDKAWMKATGIDEKRIINGTFTMKVNQSTECHTREEAGIPKDVFCIALVGARLDSELTDEFLNCMEEHISDDVFYLLLGECATYAEKVKRHPRLIGHIRYLGFVNDTQSFLKLCDLYLNPPRTGGGFSSTEAMVNGIAPISLSYGDVSIAIGDDFCVNSVDEMFESISRHMTDKEYHKYMSDKARQRGELLQDSERFFVENINKFTERFVI